MKDEIKEILEKIKSVSNFDDYVDFVGTEFKPLLDYINNLQEIRKEHNIMKQFIYENGLWEKFLNDDRFLEHLRSDDNE